MSRHRPFYRCYFQAQFEQSRSVSGWLQLGWPWSRSSSPLWTLRLHSKTPRRKWSSRIHSSPLNLQLSLFHRCRSFLWSNTNGRWYSRQRKPTGSLQCRDLHRGLSPIEKCRTKCNIATYCLRLALNSPRCNLTWLLLEGKWQLPGRSATNFTSTARFANCAFISYVARLVFFKKL